MRVLIKMAPALAFVSCASACTETISGWDADFSSWRQKEIGR